MPEKCGCGKVDCVDLKKPKTIKSELKRYLDFVDTAVYDSPHSGDDDLMEWHNKMLKKLEEMID